jgi:hypothetical protein
MSDLSERISDIRLPDPKTELLQFLDSQMTIGPTLLRRLTPVTKLGVCLGNNPLVRDVLASFSHPAFIPITEIPTDGPW